MELSIKTRLRNIAREYKMIWAVLVVAVLMSFLSEAFLTPTNLMSVFVKMTTNGIIAVGMTFVLIAGEIDLSVGYVLTFCSFVFLILTESMPLIFAILITLLIGAVFGAVNGFFVARVGIASFIVTLATSLIARTLSLHISGGYTLRNTNEIISALGKINIGIFPLIFFIFALFIIIGQYVLLHTAFGRNVFAVGGNAEYARKAGIGVVKHKLMVFILSGIITAIASIIFVARIGSASPSAGDNICLPVIASVVIGGTHMTGGSGNEIKTFIGCVLMALLTNAINLLGFSSHLQTCITGVIIIGVVGVDAYLSNRKKSLA